MPTSDPEYTLFNLDIICFNWHNIILGNPLVQLFSWQVNYVFSFCVSATHLPKSSEPIWPIKQSFHYHQFWDQLSSWSHDFYSSFSIFLLALYISRFFVIFFVISCMPCPEIYIRNASSFVINYLLSGGGLSRDPLATRLCGGIGASCRRSLQTNLIPLFLRCSSHLICSIITFKRK